MRRFIFLLFFLVGCPQPAEPGVGDAAAVTVASHAQREPHRMAAHHPPLELTACPPLDAGVKDAGHDAGGCPALDAGHPVDAMVPDVASPPPGALSLRVLGNHLIDATGKNVRLLGVNRSGQEFACIQGGTPGALGWEIYDGPTDLASAQAIAGWHLNTVRIPLNEDCWLGINGVSPLYGGPAYRAAIVSYVATLHAAGLYVLVDLHWNAPGALPALSQQPMPDADHGVAFWTSVASTFSSDAATAFDLYNEPFLYGTYQTVATQDPWDLWLNGGGLNQYLTGGTPYTLPMSWTAVGMQTLVSTVRATGAKNVILVGGLAWANDLSGWLTHEPKDPLGQLAAAWHSYPGEACDTQACWTSQVAPVAAVVPIVTGEVGDAVCSAVTYVPTLLPWMDTQKISYVGWTWNTWGDCNDVLITDYTGTPTANYGASFKSLVATSAGLQ